MVEWLTALFDSRIFMRADAVFGFLFLGFFVFLYFSKEGKDERGRGLIATASLIAFVMLFVLLNIYAGFYAWSMDHIVRLSNGIQTVYTLFLLTAEIALLILRKIRWPEPYGFKKGIADTMQFLLFCKKSVLCAFLPCTCFARSWQETGHGFHTAIKD